MKIVILGAPASGKGTVAKKISRDFNIPHISIGAMFRENINKKTQLGCQVEQYITTGELVPDNITCDLLKIRLKQKDCENGFILDGFPRNVNQAKFLNEFSAPEVVLLLSITEQESIKRILGRLTCPKCKEIYNLSFYKNSSCEICGTTLEHRVDDNEETIKNRFNVYQKETKPLIDFYNDKVVEFRGQDDPDSLYDEIKNFLNTNFININSKFHK